MAYKKNNADLEMTDIEIKESDVNELYAAAIGDKVRKFDGLVHLIETQHGKTYVIGAIDKARKMLLNKVPGMVMFDKKGHAIIDETSSNDPYLKGNEWMEYNLKKRHVLE